MKRGSIALARIICREVAGPTDEDDDMSGSGYGSVDIAEILSAEVERLRAQVEELAEAFTVVWISDDHAAWDAKAVERFNAMIELHNVEVTGAARLYRAASVWTAGLDAVDSAGSISDSRVSGAMSCSLGQVTAPKRMPT